MRTRAVLITLGVVGMATAVLAQHPARTGRGRATARTNAAAASDASVTTASNDGSTQPQASSDAGAGSPSTGSPEAARAQALTDASAPSTFNLPMVQRGTGVMTHFPIPEQLARTAVPVFAQVRTTAPIDHVSLFFRSPGATRYREIRMQTMGQEFGLPGGYGAMIPCEDAFPPAVEYYLATYDTSGATIGSAGTAAQPLSVAIVRERTHPIVPTLPGQPPPRSCGTLSVPIATTTNGGTGPSTNAGRDAGTTEPQYGTADLGEPCQRNNDCRRGLRCGSTHTCVFVDNGGRTP